MMDLGDLTLRAGLREDGLQMRPGQEQKFRVQENPSTGYKWLVDNNPDVTKNLFTVEELYVRPDAPEGMYGVPGFKEFIITMADDANSGEQGVFRAV